MKKELEYYRGLAAGGLGEVRCIPPFKNSLADVSENGRVNELAEKLLMACESLKNILSINGKLRNALDTLTETKTDLEKREVELNAENLALRERIEMLESIALKDDFVESSSSQLNGRDVAKHHHQRRAPSVESEFSLFAPRDVLPDRPSTAQASARGRSSGFPLKRCALSSVRESSENKMSVRNTQSVQAVWGSDAPQPRRESQSADGRPFSRKISLTAAAAANKQRKEQKRSTLAKKLEEYTDRYCKPNHFANYAEYYGKARQKVPVNRAAAASIKGMEDTLKQLPYTIAETVPQSLKLASQFGALTFGGVSEDVVDLEQRRQQREAKRNALLAQQQALRLNVTQAFMNVTERLDAARSFPAFSAAPAVANPYSDASAAWSKAPQSLNLSPMPVGSSTSRLRAYLAREEAVSLHSNALNALRDATGQHRDGC
ncbi:putative kinesin-like protein [Trypanosoma grayi]|uniref:putative kinesin-like protein n=1 Tax=Trypanosoma grayi TaxID=71804 RepID=UPI0004F46EA7|nr:putative kinesin-like protein [Trypanosoma grayi]KEG06182.1 putative kinesin-like protein [Trypanosoma grayi]